MTKYLFCLLLFLSYLHLLTCVCIVYTTSALHPPFSHPSSSKSIYEAPLLCQIPVGLWRGNYDPKTKKGTGRAQRETWNVRGEEVDV
jgi:hypothetical protein